MEPLTVTCNVSPCEVRVAIDLLPFSMTLEEGGAIAGAIIAVWCVAWAFRMFLRVLDESGGKTSSTSESE